MLSGQGGDPFLMGSGYPLLDQYRELPLTAFATQLLRAMIRRRSIFSLGLRGLWAGDAPRIPTPSMPEWLKRAALEKAGSMERWYENTARPGRYPRGCLYEEAYDQIGMPAWSHLFEDYYHDLFHGIDCRHPLFDTRLISFFFSIPMSLKHDKRLLRKTAGEWLPAAIIDRPKSIVTTDLVQKCIAERYRSGTLDTSLDFTEHWLDRERYADELERYAGGRGGDCFTTVGPLSLERWNREKIMLT